MKIIIAGPGCPRCQETEKRVINACSELQFPASIEHIYDIKEINNLCVLMTPAVLINGKIIFDGKIPTINEIKLEILKIKHQQERGNS